MKVREIKTVEGYVLDGTPQDIKIVGGQVQTLTFWNKQAGTLVIQKKDSVSGALIPGAQFQLTYANGGYVDNDNGHLSSNGLYTTDQTGSIIINGITGTVVVKEVKAAPGYTIDPATQTQTVPVNPMDTQTLVFLNEPLCSLTITKLDSVTGKPVPGTVFAVKDGNGTLLGRYTTGKDGTVTVTGLVPGSTVVVSEVSVPSGYVLDTTPQTIIVKNGTGNSVTTGSGSTTTPGGSTGTSGGNSNNDLTFENDPKTTLTIQKYVDGTTDPIQGVTFLVTDSSGAVVGPNNGEYVTDRNGRIVIEGLEPGVTITARETRTVSGYVLDTTPQSIKIKVGQGQTLTFYNKAEGGLELIKVNESNTTQRIPGTTFEIRKMDGALVETVTTGENGRVHVNLSAGDYYAVEIEAAQGFKLDDTPHYFTVKDGKTTTLTVKNKPFAGILIHKTDSTTGKGIYGVSFLLYDSTNTPIGQYTSDNQGYVYIEGLTAGGRYYLRELENEGYVPDNQMKTVYVKAGETTLVEWQNTPITGQIQITKTSSDYNSMNGWPAGTPIPGTEFEIYNYRTGNLVDTIRTDKNGVAVSKPLPLGRYKIVESKAADFYGLDKTPIEVELEYAGQIVKAAMTNKPLYTNVSIKKTGYAEVMPGQSIRYTFSEIGNNSTTALTSFYWRDTLPVSAVRLDKIVTGTYNAAGNYKVVYKTNLSGSNTYTMYDNLSTAKNYVLDASPAALGLASNEYITEFTFVFGVVPANFRQVEAPQVYCNVVSWAKGGSQFTNTADVGGVYNGQWIQAVTRWTTKVYGKPGTLPKTGY